MTVERLKSAVAHALTRSSLTARDVETFRRAVADGGVVSADELAELKRVASQYRDRFDAAGAQRLEVVLAALTLPVPQVPVPPQAVTWDSFSVAPSRDALAGPEKAEAIETFDRLSDAVATGQLTQDEQLLLASSAGRIGVMGEAQAQRAVGRLAKLSAADAAAFHQLTQAAASPLERAFLFKALSAGYGLGELETFARAIHGWDNARLLSTLNLGDAIVDDGQQTGVKQQLQQGCVPTSAQALRGELDPVYALRVRTENQDVHAADDHDAQRVNAKLAAEQAALLASVGGVATPRAITTGTGVAWEKMDDVYNQVSAQAGLSYQQRDFEKFPDVPLDAELDLLATQLKQGLPTPVLVGINGYEKIHAMVALEAVGSGPGQIFIVHDPWSGDTFQVTRAQFLAKKAPMGDFSAIGGFHVAVSTD